MNNAKFFIVVALLLAVAAAFSEIFIAFFYRNPADSVTSITINSVPPSYDMDHLNVFTGRAKRYLLITGEQFSSQVDPESLNVLEPTSIPEE